MDKFEILKQYKELLDNEVITKDEFENKKEEILNVPEKTNEQAGIASKLSGGISVAGQAFQKLSNNEQKAMKEETIEEKTEREAKEAEKKAEKERIAAEKKAEKERLKAERKIEIKEKFEKFKKKAKKVIIISGIVIVSLIVISIAINLILDANKYDFSGNMEKTNNACLHDMNYQVPQSYEYSKDASSEVAQRYIAKDDGDVIGILEVAYLGEEDLSGDAMAADALYDIESPDDLGDFFDDSSSVFDDFSSVYDNVSASESRFQVTLYSDESKSKNQIDLVNDIIESFDTGNYVNPRKSTGISVEYSGSTKAGVTIDYDSEGLSVKQTFDTGVAEGYKVPWYGVEKPVKLKAGEKSELTVIVGSEKETISIECSTMSESQYKAKCKNMNYKNLLRKEDNGSYVKIHGQVLQDCGSGYYRISSSGGYDNVYMVLALDGDLVEDDWCTCYGTTTGIYSYTTVMGATQKVPSMIAIYVDRK